MRSENGSPAAATAAPGHQRLRQRTPTQNRTGRGRHHPLRRRLRRRHAARRHAVHQHLRPRSATTSPPSPTSPPKSAPRPARSRASPASRSTSARSDIHTPGDALDALVVMNPAALKTNLKDLQAGRHPDRQHRRLRRLRPRQGPLQDQPARRRQPEGLPRRPRAGRQAHPRGGRRVQAQPEGGRPLQELLRAGPRVLAVRAAAGRRR